MTLQPKNMTKMTFAAGIICLALSGQTIAVDLPKLQFVHGDVKAIDIDGNTRPVAKGDILRPGEKLITGNGGMAQLRMFTQGVVALRENSGMKLNREPAGTKDNFSVKLDQGMLRTVTALGSKRGNIKIRTPGADISVKAGDALTHVPPVSKKGEREILTQRLNGEVKIKTPTAEKLAKVGETISVKPGKEDISVLKTRPLVMALKLPTLSQRPGEESPATKKADSPSSAITKGPRRAPPVISPRPGGTATPTIKRPPVRIVSPVKIPVKLAARPDSIIKPRVIAPLPKIRIPTRIIPRNIEPPVIVQYDTPPRVVSLEVDSSRISEDDKQAIKQTPLVGLTPSMITPSRIRPNNLQPVITEDTKIRADLIEQAEVVKLEIEVTRENIVRLGSTNLPTIKVEATPIPVRTITPTLTEPVRTVTPTPTIREPIPTIREPTTKETSLTCTTCTTTKTSTVKLISPLRTLR